MAMALRLSEELKDPPRLDKMNLHFYRFKVKELRYILQLADHADQQGLANKLGEVKDAIGEWHDWEELLAIPTQVLDHGAKCNLLPKLRAISAIKYENALALTNHMRLHRRRGIQVAESRGRKISKSDGVRERLELASRQRQRTASLNAIADLIGSVDGLPTDLAASKKEYLHATGYGQKRRR